MKSGFIGIIGRPNVGKSTLMNSILGEKITIASNKPQKHNMVFGTIHISITTSDRGYIAIRIVNSIVSTLKVIGNLI